MLSQVIVSLLVVGLIFAIGLIVLDKVTETYNDIDSCCANNTQFYNDTMGVCCKYSCNGTHCGSAHVAAGGNISLPNCTTAGANKILSAGCNATGTAMSGISAIPGWITIIVITIIGAILLGLISLFRRRR